MTIRAASAEDLHAVVGYARVWNREGARAFFDAYIDPRFRGRGIGSQLLMLMEARANDERLPLFVNFAAPADAAARRLFERRGYLLIRHQIRMRVELAGPPPRPEPPERITVANFVPGTDDRAVYDTMSEAFAEEPGYVPGFTVSASGGCRAAAVSGTRSSSSPSTCSGSVASVESCLSSTRTTRRTPAGSTSERGCVKRFGSTVTRSGLR